MKHLKFRLVFFIPVVCFVFCNDKPQPNKEIIQLLQAANEYDNNPKNIFSPEANIEFYDSILAKSVKQEELFCLKALQNNS